MCAWKLTRLVANTRTPASSLDVLFNAWPTGKYWVNVVRDILGKILGGQEDAVSKVYIRFERRIRLNAEKGVHVPEGCKCQPRIGL